MVELYFIPKPLELQKSCCYTKIISNIQQTLQHLKEILEKFHIPTYLEKIGPFFPSNCFEIEIMQVTIEILS